MELKEMIAELLAGENDATVPNGLSKACGFAAEALELVAWAEENVLEIAQISDTEWRCYTVLGGVNAPTLLGAIRAAKEAYEQQG